MAYRDRRRGADQEGRHGDQSTADCAPHHLCAGALYADVRDRGHGGKHGGGPGSRTSGLGCSLSIPGDLPMTKGSRLSDPWANPHEHSVKEVWLQVWRHAGRHSGLGDHSKASASGGGDRHAGVSFGALCGNVAGRRVAQPGYPHPGLYGIDRQRRGREKHRDRCDQPRLRRWWYSRTVCRIPTSISRGSTGS